MRNRMIVPSLVAAIIAGCLSSAKPPASSADTNSAGPSDVCSPMCSTIDMEQPPPDATAKEVQEGPYPNADVVDSQGAGHDAVVDVFDGSDPGADSLLLDVDVLSVDVLPPSDVSLVTSCEPSNMLAVLEKAKKEKISGFLYVVGGISAKNPKGDESVTVQKLDLANGVWTTAGIVPELRHKPMSTWVAGALWMFGGDSCPAAVSPEDSQFACPSKFPSTCEELKCDSAWKGDVAGQWTLVDFPLSGTPHVGVQAAGCNILLAAAPWFMKVDGHTGKQLEMKEGLFPVGTYQAALSPWQDGFAVLGGASKWSPGPQQITLLDASGNPTGKFLPAPPCAVKAPVAWATETHLLILDEGSVAKPADECSGLLSSSAPTEASGWRPVAWDGTKWSKAPVVDLSGQSQFVQTPNGVLVLGATTYKGKGLSWAEGLAWMDPATLEWSDSKFPPMPIPKTAAAATWAPN